MDAAAKRRARLAKWNQAKNVNHSASPDQHLQDPTYTSTSLKNPIPTPIRIGIKPAGVRKKEPRNILSVSANYGSAIEDEFSNVVLEKPEFSGDLLDHFVDNLTDTSPEAHNITVENVNTLLEQNSTDSPKELSVEPETNSGLSITMESSVSQSSSQLLHIAPLSHWAEAGLPTVIMQTLRDSGYNKLTAIQARAIPLLQAERDVIAVAPTGSGKTLAYSLPIVKAVYTQRRSTGKRWPRALVLTPTRELCRQVCEILDKYSSTCGLVSLELSGGGNLKSQISRVKAGVDILVSTPGRLIDVLVSGPGSNKLLSLELCKLLVLDEADRMLDLGFGPQISKICESLPKPRQTALFSATLPNFLKKLAYSITVNATLVQIGSHSRVAHTIEQRVEITELSQKLPKLLEILKQLYNTSGQALIFCEKQLDADKLCCELLKRGLNVSVLHGGMSQIDRDDAIIQFKKGHTLYLVATSLAARGLDIAGLAMVINYDPPNHLEDYIHRAGRTGRAGHPGISVTLLLPTQIKNALIVSKAFKGSGKPVPEEIREILQAHSLDDISAKSGRGFGGHGLAHMEEKSQSNSQLIKQIVLSSGDLAKPEEFIDPWKANVPVKLPKSGQSKARPEPEIEKFKVRTEVVYRLKVPINNFHPQVRAAVSSALVQSRIMEAHKVSLVGKGEYHPPGQPSLNGSEELHILIEGRSEATILGARDALYSIIDAKTDDLAHVSGKY